MGSYASFSIDGYQLLSSKYVVDAVVMMVFTEAEKRISKNAASGDEIDPEELTVIVEYVAPGRVVLERLEAMGFTLPATRSLYERYHAHRLAELEERSSESDCFAELHNDETTFHKRLDWESWIKHFCELKQKDVHYWDFTLNPDSPVVQNLSPIEKFILNDDCLFRFPPYDIRYFIRAVIEACGIDSGFRVDVSDFVSAGYNRAADSFALRARDELVLDYPINTKVIILTEGVTDRRVLEASLKLLYPHLAEYYAFMDFESANAPGGAGQLVNTVKAFAGAGISNRVVALFDNDTAARSALRGLQNLTLPSSLRVLQYPAIDVALKYPTRGPSGLVEMDVNGSAGSLEIYFGDDILRQANGILTPVHWRGFDVAVQAYQGEIENKASLQEKMERKLNSAIADPSLIPTQDWSGIRAILEMVRHCFQNKH